MSKFSNADRAAGRMDRFRLLARDASLSNPGFDEQGGTNQRSSAALSNNPATQKTNSSVGNKNCTQETKLFFARKSLARVNSSKVGNCSSKKSHSTSGNDPEQSSQPKPKFRYEPLHFERAYYYSLFYYVASSCCPNPIRTSDNQRKLIEKIVLAPREAAKLFYASGIPSEQLRMIWNMATMPASPPPPYSKPPPALTLPQFQVAVRLIQLFQNRVTAKDDRLNVSEDAMKRHTPAVNKSYGPDGLSPAYFLGVSEVIVPLPLSRSLRKTDDTQSLIETDSQTRGKPNKQPNHFLRRSTGNTDFEKNGGDQFCGNSMVRAASEEEKTEDVQDNSNSCQPLLQNESTSSTDITDDKWRPCQNRRESQIIAYNPEIGYEMEDDEVATYKDTFGRHSVTDDLPSSYHENYLKGDPSSQGRYVYVDRAVNLFEKSGLSRNAIGKLWDVVVLDPNAGKLDEVEFVLLTHLIVCVTRRGMDIPTELPSSLRDWKENQVKKQICRSPSSNSSEISSVTKGSPSLKNDNTVKRNSTDIVNSERVKEMEREILSLKAIVISLRDDVRNLKAELSVGKQDSNNDPNLDVEMYWTEKREDEKRAEIGKSSYYNNREAINLLDLTRNGVSRNIPSVHPSFSDHSAKEKSKNEHNPAAKTSQQNPPSQPPPKNPNHGNIYEGSEFKRSPSDPTHDAEKQEKQPTNPALESRKNVKNVSRQHAGQPKIEPNGKSTEKIENIATRARERLESDASSYNSSQRSNHEGGKRKVQFNDRKPFAKSMFGAHSHIAHHKTYAPRKQPGTSRRPFIESSRHIVRNTSGTTEVYTKESIEPPSTRALDLPPLEPPPASHFDPIEVNGTSYERRGRMLHGRRRRKSHDR